MILTLLHLVACTAAGLLSCSLRLRGCVCLRALPFAVSGVQTPGVGDYHGCPFRHFDKPQLQKLLASFDLSASQIASVMKFHAAKDFQLACKEFFVQTHPGNEGDGVGNHPNHFYEASRRHHRRKHNAASTAANGTVNSSCGTSTDSSSGRESRFSGKSRSYNNSGENAVDFATTNGHDVTMEAPHIVSCGSRGRDGGGET